jgi:hypothetical protein
MRMTYCSLIELDEEKTHVLAIWRAGLGYEGS